MEDRMIRQLAGQLEPIEDEGELLKGGKKDRESQIVRYKE
jgi:hypothetical protein